ncbi:ABC transporter permease [Dyadobacter sp. CY323]|uniref:ABC transporter permease n=1 Tax=Dyadobacter sp. CY323 TaxID=2907302 RepID=UPI001F27A952|nr:ABC transporter permease [Dyadobacter sp. CY323]MCE6989637.1 ABC transporter permease [Dyadobacter sp. CY323]
MLQNYFKIAWRNLLRSKTYSILILAGLACGMTCAIVLGLFVNDELSFDGYHRNADRIYRTILDIKWADNRYNMATAAAPFGPTLQREYPEIQKALRVKQGGQIFRNGNHVTNVKELYYVDSTLFDFFDYTFTEGDPRTALNSPGNVVLTQKLANVLFGKTSGVVGKTVLVKDNVPFTVSGIIRDVPSNHHLKFDALLPYSNREVSNADPENWGNFNTFTYLMLNNEQVAKRLESKMPAFYKKYIAKTVGGEGQQKLDFDITFQPLSEIHLKSSHLMGEENGSSMRYVYTISLIGLFILLIAIVNYINLATARATGRAKEIGIRKAVGSQTFQLIGQFLSESILISVLAMLASLFLLYALLPFFNEVADKKLMLNIFNVKTVVLFAAFTLTVGLVSGLYPAFILSKYNPALVLKGPMAAKGQGSFLRQSLVVFQFAISMLMIVGTIVVYRQLQFMTNKELGFSKQQVITIPLKGPIMQQSAGVLKNRILQTSGVTDASLTNGTIGAGLNNKSTFDFYTKTTDEPVSSEHFIVDENFLGVLKIPVKEGRNFSAALDNDSSRAVLVNEATLKRLGWKSRTDGLIEVDARKVEITGVIKDFHLRSLHNQIEPLILVLKQSGANNLLIRISQQNIPATISLIKQAFTEINPNQPFEYDFLDQAFAKQYKSDELRGTMFLTFSGIAILIASIGLFGLATFTARQRTKEIGVRKVLGASVTSVVALLSVDFLKLVFIAILIAAPVGWYLMHTWLQTFAYKINIEWWVFALAGATSIVIAFVTVSFQSIRAALSNPVKSLRCE